MNNTAYVIFNYITNDGTVSAFFLMLWTLMIKTQLASFYFSLLYFGIECFKKSTHKNLSAHANCYCWYVLLFSVALANLGISNYLVLLSYQPLYAWDQSGPYLFLTGCLLSVAWFSVVIWKLLALTLLKRKVNKAIKHMSPFEDNEGLTQRALSALCLRKKPRIMIACFTYTPVSYGVFNKTILLPDNYKDKYTAAELYLLLLHEMTHIKNGDTIRLFMVSVAECILWTVPIMRRFVEGFRRDIEILCDNCVIDLQRSERDVYGNLILKECAYRTASFGFGFSDSYHAIEDRLDALYRNKSNRYSKLLAVIPATVLCVCVFSYTLRTDWFVVNDKYNREFEVVVSDSEYTDFIPLSTESCAKVYELEPENLIIDTRELYSLTEPYADKGYREIRINSYNYVAKIYGNTLSTGSGHLFDIHDLTNGQDGYAPFIQSIEQRTPLEYLFLKIASWL